MQMNQKATTELEAVNYFLLSVGEHPVNSLQDTRSATVSQAKKLLNQVSRQTQSIGLNCNTEKNYPFTLTPVGMEDGESVSEIRVPENVIRIDASDREYNVVRRGNKLYDKERHTYYFDEPLECDVVWFLPFEELPQVVRDYITLKGARIYQTKMLGSSQQNEFALRDEQEAYTRLRIEEIDTGDYNIFNNKDIQRMNRRR